MHSVLCQQQLLTVESAYPRKHLIEAFVRDKSTRQVGTGMHSCECTHIRRKHK